MKRITVLAVLCALLGGCVVVPADRYGYEHEHGYHYYGHRGYDHDGYGYYGYRDHGS